MKLVILLLMIQFTTAWRVNTPRKINQDQKLIENDFLDSHQFKIKRFMLNSPLDFLNTLDRILAEAEHKAEIE